MSMPAQLQIERVDEIDENHTNHVQFAPLTQVLDNRARRRLRPDELQVELDEARQQIDELRASSLYNGDDNDTGAALSDDDDDALVMLNRDSLMEGESVVVDRIDEQVVERYERELQQMSKTLGESQGALRVITIALQNLRYVEAGASSIDILNNLRQGFEDLRAQTENGIFYELNEKLAMLHDSQKTEVLLRRQYEGVLDLLGESEERVKELEANVSTLDKTNEDKQRVILELEERNTALTTLTNDQIAGLENDNQNKDTSLQRLREALDKYREDLDHVTTTATEFEATHHDMIARIEQEHATAMEELEAERAAEQEGRLAAEADVDQKNEYIQQLEESITRMEAEVDNITAEISALTQRLGEEEEARKDAEQDRDEQNLNETITELREQLADARENLEAERAQREQTEADLDEAKTSIEELSNRLHNTGLQANELRRKKEAAISELEQEAEEREDDLNNQLAAETKLREAGEDTIEQLKQDILDLQAQIATLDDNLADMTQARNDLEQERDVQVEKLYSQLEQVETKYSALENSTKSTITSLQANITDLNNQVQQQQNDIDDLMEQVAERDRAYLEDTTALKDEVDVLKNDLTKKEAENEAYAGKMIRSPGVLRTRQMNCSTLSARTTIKSTHLTLSSSPMKLLSRTCKTHPRSVPQSSKRCFGAQQGDHRDAP
ncbi:Myosin-tail-1 multi-domain protein [Pyrenophora tritici-repentis]|nr:Myosin-tail-1 multi-domain protein [Pyrenophora tritici-repentis]